MKKLDLSVLPAPQRMLWDNLHPFSGFVLYGGTAIALQLGHRQSVDFDFFSNDPLNLDSLEQELNPIGKAVLLRRLNNTLEYLIDGVKVSFFGSLSFGCIEAPLVSDNGILVASLVDLFGHKLKVIQQRAEYKDYADIAALLESGLSLTKGLSAACSLFSDLNPQVSLRALSFFGDVHGLSPEQEKVLEAAASAVREVPVIHPISHRINADFTAHGEDIKDSNPAMLPKEETIAKKKWW